jgi:phage shock protein C
VRLVSTWDESPFAAAAPARPQPRLARSRDQRVVAGVCGGIARAVNLDPLVVRLITVGLVVAGVGIIVPAYLVAMFAMPLERAEGEWGREARSLPSPRVVVGWLMVVTGAFVLLDRLNVDLGLVTAAGLVALGINLVVRHRR